MKLKLKLMAAAVALAASAGANAAITNAQSGNGELFFTIYDAGSDLSSAADDRAYVRDLGSLANGSILGGTINDWSNPLTSAAGLAANPLPADKQDFGTIFSISADANLQSFLTASTDTARLQWNIVAADTSGTDRLLTTANSVVAPTYTQFRTFGGGVDINLELMNPALAAAESALYAGSDAGLIGWGNNIGGRTAFSNATGLGGSLGFFILSERATTGTTTLADVRQFMADPTTAMEWTLAANGELTYGALNVPAIPEPSEYALMLAGLGMLGFMARRRLANRV